MKRIIKFLDEAPMLKVFLVMTIFLSVLAGAAGFFAVYYLGGKRLSSEDIVMIGLLLGTLFSIFVTLGISQIRKSIKFWEFARDVEEMIEEAETKDRLDDIFANEFQILRNMSLGGPHTQMLSNLYTIMKTKYQYLA